LLSDHLSPDASSGIENAEGKSRRVVVKVGTNLLAGGGGAVNEGFIGDLARQAAHLRAHSLDVLLVTSGAVAAGGEPLDRTGRADHLNPRSMPYRQVLASLGQTQLMRIYERRFEEHGIVVAQVLISRGDIQSRLGYLNIRNTLEALLDVGAVPVVNENDVVAVEELEGQVYGDNDRLSALVANLIDADLLILLGEIEGMFTADPHSDPDARLIPRVERIDEQVELAAGDARDGRGRGGMASKVAAARLATGSGARVVIASGRVPDVLVRLSSGEALGTVFHPSGSRVESRKRWILTGASESRGSVTVDAGAAKALRDRGGSLLPAGIVNAEGAFERGDIIAIADPGGDVFAWGLANYPCADVVAIRGRRSAEVEGLLGYEYGPEVVHRNDMALIEGSGTSPKKVNDDR